MKSGGKNKPAGQTLGIEGGKTMQHEKDRQKERDLAIERIRIRIREIKDPRSIR